MVAIGSFILLALSALPAITEAAHIPSNIHHRAALQARSAHACRDAKVPAPVKKLVNTGPGNSSASKPASSSKPSPTPKSGKGKDDNKDNDKGKPDVGGSPDIPSGGSGGGSKLFPLNVKSSIHSFSTSPASGNALPLTESTFHASHVSHTDGSKWGTAPDGSKALQAIYHKGSSSPGHSKASGGFSFYAATPIDFTDGNTVTLTYSVMFEKGFSWVKGGKLPGLYGGINDEVASTCSGGRHNPGCFSARMMWRAGGAMELYAYFPQTSQNDKVLSAIPPHVGDNDTYGHSVGRGLFKFTPGQWTTIGQRLTLNTPGKNDGSIEIYVNGKSLFVAHGLMFRSSASGKVRGIQMQTFHGGHDGSWAPSKTQSAYFKDFSAAVYH